MPTAIRDKALEEDASTKRVLGYVQTSRIMQRVWVKNWQRKGGVSSTAFFYALFNSSHASFIYAIIALKEVITMTALQFRNFDVYCNANPSTIQHMQVRFIITEEGRPFYSPCNGCELMKGSTICKQCLISINEMLFYDNPDFTQPLSIK